MIIGHFSTVDPAQEPGNVRYRGSIRTLWFGHQAVTFDLVDKKGEGPDFVVMTVDYELPDFEIGVAWTRVSAKTGKKYLSVKLLGPGHDPVNCALIKNESGYVLIWNRDRKEAADEATSEAVA